MNRSEDVMEETRRSHFSASILINVNTTCKHSADEHFSVRMYMHHTLKRMGCWDSGRDVWGNEKRQYACSGMFDQGVFTKGCLGEKGEKEKENTGSCESFYIVRMKRRVFLFFSFILNVVSCLSFHFSLLLWRFFSLILFPNASIAPIPFTRKW